MIILFSVLMLMVYFSCVFSLIDAYIDGLLDGFTAFLLGLMPAALVFLFIALT